MINNKILKAVGKTSIVLDDMVFILTFGLINKAFFFSLFLHWALNDITKTCDRLLKETNYISPEGNN